MSETSNIERLDKKMQDDGWTFLGAILHYEKAWKEQASIYKKDEKYVVSIKSDPEDKRYECKCEFSKPPEIEGALSYYIKLLKGNREQSN